MMTDSFYFYLSFWTFKHFLNVVQHIQLFKKSACELLSFDHIVHKQTAWNDPTLWVN